MIRKVRQKLKLRSANHYLLLLVCLSFLAGQVQYAYTTYYCTVEHAEVKQPLMGKYVPAGKLNNKICNECQGVEILHHTVGVSEPSCLRVDSHKKNVVDSFVDEEVTQSHPKITIVATPGDHACRSIAQEAIMLLPHGASPPGNIPTPSINLCI